MSHIEDEVNEYGIPRSVHRCDTCGGQFTVTPAVPAEIRDQWDTCMSEDCPSYEPTRDADLYLELGMVNKTHDPRCLSLTDSEFTDVCDCETLRMIDDHGLTDPS